MIGKAQENRLLDFKLALSDDLSKGDDKKTLAEAISGFSNSEGGVLIWGVDARKNNKDGVDEVVGTPGLNKPRLFLSRLLELTAGATSPAVLGVDHRVLRGSGGPSFVATYVPSSDQVPVMAKAGQDRYFTRSAGSFLRMEHFQVADMFARRSRPQLSVEAQLVDRGTSLVKVLLGVKNTGQASAVAPFIQFRILNGYPRFDMGIDGNRREMIPYAGTDHQRWAIHNGGMDLVIHPGRVAWVAAAFLGYGHTGPAKVPCLIEYEAGALHASAVSGRISIDFMTGESSATSTA